MRTCDPNLVLTHTQALARAVPILFSFACLSLNAPAFAQEIA